ncbi:MAG TPA: type IV pilin [Thermoplasmatales archaeon]|nr:type IV pilin [Thermoplasmatales archaeon]
MRKKLFNKKAVSPIVGTVLMVAIAVALATAVYIILLNVGTMNQQTQRFITFSQERSNGRLTVVYAGDEELEWSKLIVSPSSVEKNDTNNDGYIDAGEYLYNCTGKTVTVTWEPTNTLLGTWDFT